MTNEEIIKLCINHTATPDRIEDLGILKFGKLFFRERFSQKYSMIHYKMILLLLKLLDPRRANAMDKQAYFLVHRMAAKTSISTFLVPTFLIFLRGHTIITSEHMLDWDMKTEPSKWFKDHDPTDKIIEVPINEDFIIIASETASSSEEFVNNIRNILNTNKNLMNIFGEKSPKYIEADDRGEDKIWRRNTFITADNTIIRGVGVGQQLRGRIVGGRRPSFIIIDDMYSENNVKSEQSRENLSRWLFNAAVNSLDMERGKMLWLGTLLHPDTVVKSFRRSEFWFGLEIPIISTKELSEAVLYVKEQKGFERQDFFTNKEAMLGLKKLEDKFTTMSWKEKHNLRLILMKYKELMVNNRLNYFYQEFMNEALAPEVKLIQPEAFYRTDITVKKKGLKQIVSFEYEGLKWEGEIIVYAALDPASSIANNSDDTAIMAGGLARCYPIIPGIDDFSTLAHDIKGRIFPVILHMEGGKYAIHDYEELKGMAEALLRLDKQYLLEQIRIEANGQQMHVVRSIKQTFEQEHSFTRIWDVYNTGRKDERILSITLPMIQHYKVIICEDTPLIDKLYVQLLTCGIADHDDYADVFSILFKDLRPPEIPNDIRALTKKQGVIEPMSKYELYKEVINPRDRAFFI